MSTLIALLVIACAASMIVAFQAGYQAGQRDGFAAGVKHGKKEASVKAFAVGYDRGKHEREAESAKTEVAAPKPKNDAIWNILLCVSALVLIGLIVLMKKASRP
ncbi:MAG: hypothetical protein R3C28_23810 [Pirellulaceae bacterium]